MVPFMLLGEPGLGDWLYTKGAEGAHSDTPILHTMRAYLNSDFM